MQKFVVSVLDRRHAKLWGQLRQCFLAFDRGECHLCFEGRPMMASRSLHRLVLGSPLGASIQQGDHLPHCQNFRDSLWAEVPNTSAYLTCPALHTLRLA